VFITVFVIAACGLGYELVAGALASYLLGDSVARFSIAIGLYLFALGIGAWLSKFLETRLAERFVDVDLAVALVGGPSAAALLLGLANAAIALWSTWVLGLPAGPARALRVRCGVVLALLVAGVAGADRLTSLAEDAIYADEVVFAKSTPYQRIVVTRNQAGF